MSHRFGHLGDGDLVGLGAAQRRLLALPQRLVKGQVLGHHQDALALHLHPPTARNMTETRDFESRRITNVARFCLEFSHVPHI